MKRLLLLTMLSGASLGLAPSVWAQRTDSTRTTPASKPQLNTAPPGAQPVPRPAPAAQPAPEPQAEPAAEPTPPGVPASRAPAYDPARPSGMDLPQRPGVAAPEPPLRRLFIYSNFGLGYSGINGFGQFNANIGPALGYQLTERIAAGPGLTYAFNSISFPDFYRAAGYPNSIQLHSLGVKVFAQVRIIDQFFLHGEYEVTRAQTYAERLVNAQQVEIFKVSRTYQTPLAGVGYRQNIGERTAADIVVLYNFNDGFDAQGNQLSPYSQPVIRFNFLYRLGR